MKIGESPYVAPLLIWIPYQRSMVGKTKAKANEEYISMIDVMWMMTEYDNPHPMLEMEDMTFPLVLSQP